MGKEVLRNGSFERGDLKVWEMTTGNEFSIYAFDKKYGVYSAQIRSDAAGLWLVEHKDYIPVGYGDIFRLSAWIKSTHLDTFQAGLGLYDADLNSIGSVFLLSATYTNAWVQHKGWGVLNEEASYARFLMYSTGGALADSYYIDSLSLQQITLEEVASEYLTLITVENENVEHTVYSDQWSTEIWKEAEYTLKCTSLTGGTPLLDVSIQAYDIVTALWTDIVTFQQLGVGGGSERKVLTEGLGRTQRVKYVTSDVGVLSDCDFKVTGLFKR